MSNEANGIRVARTLKTVRNAVWVLRCLSADGPLSLAQMARRLGVGKSTAHLLIQTLLHEGLVEFDAASAAYRVGLGVFEIGTAAVEQSGYGIRLIPAMERLARRCNESVSLGVLSAGSVIFVQRIESPEILRADIRPGTRMPLHASASGKVLLAGLSDEAILALFPGDPLPPSADRTLRTRHDLLAQVRHVRAAGYATNIEEYVNGISAIAAPVRDAAGQTVAALSIAGPSLRFAPEHWVPSLLVTAAELSQLLGYRSARPVAVPA